MRHVYAGQTFRATQFLKNRKALKSLGDKHLRAGMLLRLTALPSWSMPESPLVFPSPEAYLSGRRMPSDTIVIVPTYNERDNLPEIAMRLMSLPVEVDLLVVDDNSPDGTGKLADEFAKTNPRVHV